MRRFAALDNRLLAVLDRVRSLSTRSPAIGRIDTDPVGARALMQRVTVVVLKGKVVINVTRRGHGPRHSAYEHSNKPKVTEGKVGKLVGGKPRCKFEILRCKCNFALAGR